MVADRPIEGRLMWTDIDDHDGKRKPVAYYYHDKDSRKEAVKYAQSRTYSYEEHRAEPDPANQDALVYRRI